jgi:hypothetical protein
VVFLILLVIFLAQGRVVGVARQHQTYRITEKQAQTQLKDGIHLG